MKRSLLSLVVLLGLVAQDLQAVSVQTLIDQNKIPQITGPAARRTLNLSDLKIDDLTGLQNIPNIDSVHVLILNRNRLKIIRAGDFKKLTQLESIGIRNNLLTKLQPGSFIEPRNLKAVRLGHNKLKTIPDGVFDPKLSYLGLAANPISKTERAKLREKLPNTQIFYIPPTDQILIAAGLTIATIVLILAAAGKPKKVIETKKEAGKREEVATAFQMSPEWANVKAQEALLNANNLFVAASTYEHESNPAFWISEANKTRAKAQQVRAEAQRVRNRWFTVNEADVIKKEQEATRLEEAAKQQEDTAGQRLKEALNLRERGNDAWAKAAAFAQTSDTFGLQKKFIEAAMRNEDNYPTQESLETEERLFPSTEAQLSAQSALDEAKLFYLKPYAELKARGQPLIQPEIEEEARRWREREGLAQQ